MKKYFKAKCPYCHNWIRGSWDWSRGYLCVNGFCSNCDIYILEDETDWEEEELFCKDCQKILDAEREIIKLIEECKETLGNRKYTPLTMDIIATHNAVISNVIAKLKGK